MASYKQAIEWMVENDDTEWVEADPHSVTAALVAELRTFDCRPSIFLNRYAEKQ